MQTPQKLLCNSFMFPSGQGSQVLAKKLEAKCGFWWPGGPHPQLLVFFVVNSWCCRVLRYADVEVVFFAVEM